MKSFNWIVCDFLKYRLWPLLLAGVIFYASSISFPTPLPAPGVSDKAIHFVLYGLLGFLTARAFIADRKVVKPWNPAFVAAVLSGLYGLSDEWHQSYVLGRYPSVADAVADIIGAFAGAFIYVLVLKMYAKKRGAND